MKSSIIPKTSLTNCIYCIYNALIRTGGNNLKIIISNQSELPIYAQIREQIKNKFLTDRLKKERFFHLLEV